MKYDNSSQAVIADVKLSTKLMAQPTFISGQMSGQWWQALAPYLASTSGLLA